MFSSEVDNLVFSWSDYQQETFKTLRALILETNPAITESVKYKVPFYTLNGLLMYVSPVKEGGFYLGFCQGDIMLDAENLFAQANTKNVRKMFFTETLDVDWQIVQSYVFEAIEINLAQRSFSKTKKPH